jgi:hypothetical protein
VRPEDTPLNRPGLTGLSLPDHNRLASSITDRLDARGNQPSPLASQKGPDIMRVLP